MNKITKPPLYLYRYVNNKVDLPEFLSTEIQCHLNWHEPGVSAGTICPMPHHRDSKPSFQLKLMEGVWVYHCLGCGAKGTIINFCMEYYGISTYAESVLFICKKFNLKQSDISVADSLELVKKKVNLQMKVNCAHIVAARQCFTLLKKDFLKYNTWVKESYKTMNKALDAEDAEAIETIESIGTKAFNKMREK